MVKGAARENRGTENDALFLFLNLLKITASKCVSLLYYF